VPKHVIALLGTLKAPTGNNTHLAPIDGGAFDEHKQIGTGTWDEFVGIFVRLWRFPHSRLCQRHWALQRHQFARQPLWQRNLRHRGVRRSLLDSKRLYLAVDAQVRSAGKDTTPSNSYDENSGGFVGYAAGSAGYAITDNLLIRGTVQVPVVTALNGAQSEHPVAYFALAYDFAL